MRIKEFEALPAGVYLMTVADLGLRPSPVIVTERYELCMLDVALQPHSPMWIRAVDLIQSLKPLERQGGISGAMYWGDPV